MALDNDALSADEQAQLDAMRAADAQPGSDAAAGTAEPSADQPGAGAEAPPAGGETAEKQRQQMVPHAALHEERELRKAEQKAREEDRQRWETRYQQLIERLPAAQPQQPAQPAAPAIPDLAADPVGHIVGTLQQQGATQAQIVQAIQGYGVQQQQQQVMSGLRNWAISHETEFLAENPDYSNATAHLKATRQAELRAMGLTPERVVAQMEQDRDQIAALAYQTNRNFAQVVMEMSKARGYAPKPADRPAAAAAIPETQPDAAARIETVRAGQEQARSLGNARGAAPAPMTADRLLKMSDADFDKALSSPDGLALLGA